MSIRVSKKLTFVKLEINKKLYYVISYNSNT